MLFHASWIVPIAGPPIRDGWVATDRGRVVALGSERPGNRAQRIGPGDGAAEIDLGAVALLPGLVNAHTHLELSWMAGAVPPGASFPDWIKAVIELRRAGPLAGPSGAQAAIDAALAACHDTGTALVGDVANTVDTVAPLAASRLHGVVFRELIGFRNRDAPALVEAALADVAAAPRAPNVRVTLGAHAPYSVSPLLFRAIRAALALEPFVPASVHLGESSEELTFLASGDGPWRALLEALSAWDPTWEAPGCGPVEYLDRMGFLDDRVLCVHAVHLDEAALRGLARRRATLVTCPRGNRLTGAGSPPVAAFYASGLRVAVGTDSLASVPDLNLFSELAELRRLAPAVPAALLLESATLHGARALGWDDEFGSIEPGKRAALVAVTLPGAVADVEQYLVGGIGPDQIHWVAA
jgi:cytosine/adenosine deaminase-related metal-dependent hydrolase